MKEINSFKKGITSGIPICLGYLSVSFAFGIFAVKSGFSVLEAVLISLTNVTSAGQLAGVPIIASGGSLVELAVAQLVINSRYSLMSISLSQKLGKSISMLDRFLISFANTDEVFAVAVSNIGNVGKRYMYGLIIPPIAGWTLGTLLGALAGDILPAVVSSALGIAIYGMFIAIVVPPAKKERSTALCVLLAIVLSCIFYYVPLLKNNIPSGFTIIICSVISSAVMAAVAPLPIEEGKDE
ncbi:MAG: AzlC family ABC transporter permease [Ruminococcaceae bacterium]|nr:AzlC family ABC transporter permease [Oscillospiraceae bacterium]